MFIETETPENLRFSRVYFRSGKGEIQVVAPDFWIEQIQECEDFRYRVPLPDFSIFGERVSPRLELNPACDDLIEIKDEEGVLKIKYGDRRFNSAPQDKYLRRDLTWLILSVLERARESQGQFLVHASSIEKNGRGAVFLGQTHAGKTSLAAVLAFRYGCNVIGTEHTLLGRSGIEGGTHWMEVSRGVKQFIPELPVGDPIGQDIWGRENRDVIDLTLFNKHKSSAPLSLLVYVSVVHGARNFDLTVSEWSARKTRVLLGEWMRWMIQGSQTYLHNCRRQLPSLDTLEISGKRMTLIDEWIKEGKKVLFLKGTADDIAKEVLKRL